MHSVVCIVFLYNLKYKLPFFAETLEKYKLNLIHLTTKRNTVINMYLMDTLEIKKQEPKKN